MPIDWRTRWAVPLCLAVLLVLLLPVLNPVLAAPASQESYFPYARLSALDIQNFPRIRTYLDVYDADGSFATGLSTSEIRIIENEVSLPIAELTETHPGVQFVLAVTFGSAMGIRDSLGRSRYDYLLEEVGYWDWASNSDNPDDLSLIIDGGPEVIHQTEPDQIMRTWIDFQPDPRQAIPSLQILSRAVEIALDPIGQPGMQRAVLFITPPLEAESMTGLQSAAAQASQAGVRLFIWQIAAADLLDTPIVQQMQIMAADTGGQFINYSGGEALPNIGTYLDPMRHSYQVAYVSKAASSGTYSVVAVVSSGDLQVQSLPRSFTINLQPPNPVFMALPSHIERQIVEEKQTPQPENITPGEPILLPKETNLEVLVEFPDGYKRPLAGSALVVDGAVVWRNHEIPFDAFTWDLSGYTEDGQHLVQAVITDTLGLQGASMAMPVEILVESLPIPLSERFSGRGLWVVGVAVLVLTAVIGFVLILGERLKPYGAYQRIFSKTILPVQKRSSQIQEGKDAAAAKIEHASSNGSEKPSGLPSWINRFTRRGIRTSPKALAYLVPVMEGDSPTGESPIALHAGEIILGRDPRQVTQALSDPALQAVHTRLYYEYGKYHIFDAGTTAGTWVNFTRVPPEGIILRHGDLVHIGRTPFRFTARDSKDARKPVIIPVEQTRE